MKDDELDDFDRRIQELSRKYHVKATEITGSFVIGGRKPEKRTSEKCPKNPPKTGA